MTTETMASYATAPFNHPKADVILRSSDEVDFRVFKLFLSLASPFFETLFDLPQPENASEGDEFKDGLPVIPVTEDSATLDHLLRFCYPSALTEDPKFEVLTGVADLLEAAQKYSLPAIEKKVRQAISNLRFLATAPFQCFAIARFGGFREETLLAAKYTLSKPLIPSSFEDIDLIDASDLLALLTYHRECGNAVYALKTDLSWIRDHYGRKDACAWLHGRNTRDLSGNISCRCPTSTTPRFNVLRNMDSLQWWEDFMEETFKVLREEPSRVTLQTYATKTILSVQARGCPTCSLQVADGMWDFRDLFGRKIEEVVSRIELRLRFFDRHSVNNVMPTTTTCECQ